MSVSFEINRSHLLKVTKAEVKFDELVRTEIVPVKKDKKAKDEENKEDEEAEGDEQEKQEEASEE